MNDNLKNNTLVNTSGVNRRVTLNGKFTGAPPNTIVIGRGSPLATINLETGMVELPENIDQTEAALTFWQEVSEVYGQLLVEYHNKAMLARDDKVEELRTEINRLNDVLYEIRSLADEEE